MVRRASASTERRTHRFQIAVDDVLPAQQPQALDQRVREAPDQVETEALVVVLLDQLVQVEAAREKADHA